MQKIIKRVISLIRRHATDNSSGAIALFATWIDYLEDRITRNASYRDLSYGRNIERVIRELRLNGIYVQRDFWSSDKCYEARKEIDRLIDEYPEAIHPAAKSDKRIYGANNASNLIKEFAENADLISIASAYNQETTDNAFTLGAAMEAKSENAGSGEGWHRDAFFRQFKAILYLTDVGIDNGPFQRLRDSHKLWSILRDMKSAGLSYMQNRLDTEELKKILSYDESRLETYEAPAGTLILVDTSSIHRGMPMTKGWRYALTNYYFPVRSINSELYKKFKVLNRN